MHCLAIIAFLLNTLDNFSELIRHYEKQDFGFLGRLVSTWSILPAFVLFFGQIVLDFKNFLHCTLIWRNKSLYISLPNLVFAFLCAFRALFSQKSFKMGD